MRHDTGELWENYLLSERMKTNSYEQKFVNYYFWRTYDQQEIDMIEERDGKLYAYEFKWSGKSAKIPKAWSENYTDTEFQNINKENYLEWIV